MVNEEKNRLVNQIRLRLAVEDFELKKARLELEIAKNTDTNRPSAQFIKATEEYNAARLYAEQLADELFPKPAEEKTDAENTPTTSEQTANKKAAPEKKAADTKK